MPPKNIDELFAFVYYAWACEEGAEEITSYLGRDNANMKENFFRSEVNVCSFPYPYGELELKGDGEKKY